MKTEYTKGEWKIAIARYKDRFPSIHIYREEATEPIIGYGTGRVICEISNTDHPEAEANAHLIAQAPKLYEALKALLFQFAAAVEHPYSKDKEVYEQANQAIASVEGK